MPWPALLLLAVALMCWRYGQRQRDEALRFLGLSGALVGVMAGLVAAPGPLKLVVLMGLVLFPACAGGERVLNPDCPRLCPLRRRCRPPH